MRKAGLFLIPLLILLAHTLPSIQAHALDVGALNSPGSAQMVAQTTPKLDLRQRMNLAYPPTLSGVGNFFYRNVNADMQEWPAMNFVREPVMLDGRTFTVEDVKIISGGELTWAYAPEFDQIIDASNGVVRILGRIPAATVPPNSSLVMVKIVVQPPYEATEIGCMGLVGETGSGISPWHLRISYPGVGEFEVFDTFGDLFDFGTFNSSLDGCLNNGWYYLYLPVVDPDPQKIWLTYVDKWNPERFTIWTLIQYH